MGARSHCKRSLPYDMKFSRDLIFFRAYFDDFARPFHGLFQVLTSTTYCSVACENSRFSSLFATVDVSRGGTFATQRQKFHTDDVNQCLHNKSGSHGVLDANLFNFTSLLVDFGKVLCSSAKEIQQNSNASSREDCIPQILTVLSFVCHS